MNFVELIMMDVNGVGAGYALMDSETLLREYAAVRQSYDGLRLELETQTASLAKRFKPSDKSEAAMETAGRILDLFSEANLVLKRITAITREVIARSSNNAVNRYFGLLKISDLQGDLELQKDALKHLYGLFASIPGKKGWFHKEKWDGFKGIANLLLAKELSKYSDLDLGSTLRRMMDNQFAYLYCAYQRDFIDEMRKMRRRPFETYVEPDELEGGRAELDSVDDRIHMEQLNIRLREAALKQDHPVDREIILCSADILRGRDFLNSDDRAITAPLVSRVADETGFSKQGVGKRLIIRNYPACIQESLPVRTGQ
jgi:hypothetical protein